MLHDGTAQNPPRLRVDVTRRVERYHKARDAANDAANATGFALHTAVHAARADARRHTRYAAAQSRHADGRAHVRPSLRADGTLLKAGEIQLQTQACGAELVAPNDAVAERAAQQLYDSGANEGALDWPALLRKLDRLDRGYRG